MKGLTDLIPAKQRRRVYGALSVALTIYGLYRAAKGDWEQFAVSVASAAVAELARANVTEASA